MTKKHTSNDYSNNIDEYIDDAPATDEFSYLDVSLSEDLEQYLDFRATRKANRKGRGKKGSYGEPRRRSS